MQSIAAKLCFFLIIIQPIPAFGWSELGHAIITQIAFRSMPKQKQAEVLRLMRAHPRFAEDFDPPKGIKTDDEIETWRIGRIGYWPDVARKQPKYNRPTWHYQLGASLIVGDKAALDLPNDPGPLPAGATLEEQSLYVCQAIELCKRVLRDKSQSDSDRAVALCWIAHLVADAHQPCHAGSLYYEGVFAQPDGDRGANRIVTKQRGNLHALWDSLLGDRYDDGDARKRSYEISQVETDALLKATGTQLELSTMEDLIAESRKIAVDSVYTEEILAQLAIVKRGLSSEVPKIDLSEAYLKNAGRVAQERARLASLRLASVIDASLGN